MTMRKLIVEEWVSLDGYASDSNGKLDFFAPHVRTSYETPQRMKFREDIDIILLGGKTYAQFSMLWPSRTAEENILAVKMNTARKVVFSRSLKAAPWGNREPAQIHAGDPIVAVRELKAQSGGNLVVWGSIMLAQALIKADLVDDYHIHICPVLTGGGRKLFVEGMDATALSLVGARRYGPGIIHSHYIKQ